MYIVMNNAGTASFLFFVAVVLLQAYFVVRGQGALAGYVLLGLLTPTPLPTVGSTRHGPCCLPHRSTSSLPF